MAIPFLKHTPIGKSTQAQPGTAAANIRYISRINATNYVYAERMPSHYWAAQDFLNKREKTIRKNGRVCDKFIISIPREMTMEQATATLRKFGFQLSKGRASFYFTIQDWNQHNPHCHFTFVDADHETGKRVFGTSEIGSTDKIKLLWQEVANRELELLGIDARIDFREAERLKAQEHDNDNELQSEPQEVPAYPVQEAPSEAPTDEFEPDPEQPIEEEPEELPEEPEMARKLSQEDWLKQLRYVSDIRHQVDRKQREYIQAETQFKHWTAEHQKATAAALVAYLKHSAAEKALWAAQQQHESTHFYGLKKGVKLFGWKSQGYKKAEAAEHGLKDASYREALLKQAHAESEAYLQLAQKRVDEYKEKLLGEERQIQRIEKVYGAQLHFEKAKDDLQDAFNELTKNVTPEHIIDMHNNGQISWAEAEEYLHYMGHDDVIAEMKKDITYH